VHDRRATDLARNAVVAPDMVDDPHALDPGEKIVVMRSLRDDPLGAMHARRQIGEAQFRAGRHWQHAREICELGGLRSLDLARIRVDGGSLAPDSISDKQRRAFADLTRARDALGQIGEALVDDVLAKRLRLTRVAERWGKTREADMKFIGRRFQEALDTLAVVFGFATNVGGRHDRS
jgi:hypothetical protein